MAANYSIKELLDVLRNSDDPEVLRDAMCRYGLVSKTLIEADAISPRVTDILVAMIPDYVNARKANRTIQEALAGSDGAEDGVEEAPAEEAPAKPKKAAKKPEPEPEPAADDDADDASDAVDYGSMKAKDLFELCKKRGIEAEPRHRTKYYIDILEKADAEAEKPAAVEDDDDDDDWDI